MYLDKFSSHITYSMNVHSGEEWSDHFSAIKNFSLRVKERTAPHSAFGLGLRLSARAARQLSQPGQLPAFRQFLADNGLYVFTINGFPYGNFHGKPVKEAVYQPDWSERARWDYTLDLINILAALLPDNMPGTISTMPCFYKYGSQSGQDAGPAVRYLAEAACVLHKLHREQDREITLCLEPEPDCYPGNTAETLHFFVKQLFPGAAACLAEKYGTREDIINRYIGVCFDTCHLAVEFESLETSLRELTAAGIKTGKVQLSAAVCTGINPGTREEMLPLCDPVYLHQTRIKTGDSPELIKFSDLNPETLQAALQWPGSELRTHFHVPLYFAGYGGLRSTAACLTPAFLQQAVHHNIPHYEIETYTFDILPAHLKKIDMVDSIVAEYQWVLNQFFL